MTDGGGTITDAYMEYTQDTSSAPNETDSASEAPPTPLSMERDCVKRRKPKERPSSDELECKILSIFEKQSPNSVYGELVKSTLDNLKRQATVTAARKDLLDWVQTYQGSDGDTE